MTSGEDTPPSTGWISDPAGLSPTVSEGKVADDDGGHQWATNVRNSPTIPYELKPLADLNKFYLGVPTNTPNSGKLLSLYDVTTRRGKVVFAVSDHDTAWPHVFSPRYRVLDFRDPRTKVLAFSLHLVVARGSGGGGDAAGEEDDDDDPAAEADVDSNNDEDGGPNLPWAPTSVEVRLAGETPMGSAAFDGPDAFVLKLTKNGGEEAFRMPLGGAGVRWKDASFRMHFPLTRDGAVQRHDSIRKLRMRQWVPKSCGCFGGRFCCPRSSNYLVRTGRSTTVQEKALLIAAAVLLDLPQRAALRQQEWRMQYHRGKKRRPWKNNASRH